MYFYYKYDQKPGHDWAA